MRKLESTIGFRVPSDVRRQIEAIAAREDRQPSYIVRRIVLNHLAAQNGERQSSPSTAETGAQA